MSREIELNWPTSVTFGDGVPHRINLAESIKQYKEYTIVPFGFEGLLGEKMDGCMFKIRPRGSTRVMLITDPENTNYKSQRIAVKGRGWCLRVYKDGNAACFEVGPHLENNPLIELEKGERLFYCW